MRSSQPAIALRQILQGETLLISQAIFEEWHEVLLLRLAVLGRRLFKDGLYGVTQIIRVA